MTDWIPVAERLPTREDADERGEVVWKWADGTTCTGRFEDGGEEQDPAVAWLPLPPYTPPKPGPTCRECENLLLTVFRLNERGEFDRDITVVRRWFDEVTARIEREKQT